MILLTWLATAQAGTLVAQAEWPLSGAAADIEAVVRDGVPYVVIATSDEIVALDGAGAVAHTLARGAADVAAYDADGDGAPDLAICAADGLWLAPWTGEGLGAPALVDGAPCEAVVAHDLDGLAGIAAAGDALSVWWADGAGGLGSVERGVVSVSEPLLAAGPGALAAVGFGDSAVWERTGAGDGALDAGGAVTGIVWSASGWQVALWGARSVGPIGGPGVALEAAPRAIGSGDLDGDGRPDLLALADDARLVWLPGDGSDEASAALGEDGSALAAIDLDGDGCDEVVVGLGFSASAVVAGLEVCPVSCEPDVVIEGPAALDEGGSATWTAALSGCAAEAEGWAWSVAGAAPEDCVPDGASVTCTFPDDGAVTLSAETTTDFGASVGAVEVAVANVAPTIAPADFVEVSGGIVTVRVPCGDVVPLTLIDPGDDLVTVTPAADGNYRVDIAGVISGPPFADGPAFLVVEVVDEDGGVTVYDLEAGTPACDGDTGWDDTGWGNNPGGGAPGGDCCTCCLLFLMLMFGGVRGFKLATAAAVAGG